MTGTWEVSNGLCKNNKFYFDFFVLLLKEKKKIEGKKLYVGDEKIMSEAQRLLHEEFALVLNIKVDEVLPFILGELEPTEKEDINL